MELWEEVSIEKIGFGAALFCLVSTGLWAQPKLVVQVVVDQMRAEYLQRFSASI